MASSSTNGAGATSSALSGSTRLDMAHDPAPPSELPTISRNPSLAAAIQAIDVDTPHTENVIRIGTRASPLALVQANLVLEGLQALGLGMDFKLAPMSVAGDRNKIEPLYLMGGKALWTKDLEVALVENAVDCIVHSFKDVPTLLPEGCEIAAVLEREDPRDALVVKAGKPWKTLEELPEGSCVGSSSVRRIAQLRRKFPHLKFQDCRGNIETRLKKLDDENGPFDALILASAGLLRTNRDDRITGYLSSPTMLHATGQGAIAVEIRSGDSRMKDLVSRLNHSATEWRTSCERALLRTLEGGCSVPVGVETRYLTDASPASKKIELRAVIVSLDGQTAVEHVESRDIKNVKEAEQLGIDIAEVLIQGGGKTILEELGRIVAQKNVKGVNDQIAMAEKTKSEAVQEHEGLDHRYLHQQQSQV